MTSFVGLVFRFPIVIFANVRDLFAMHAFQVPSFDFNASDSLTR